MFFFFNDTATTEIYTLSLHDALPICKRAGANRRAAVSDRVDAAGPRSMPRSGGAGGRQHCENVRAAGPACRDRKSTRLNSSHANISYADFCLKIENEQLPPSSPQPLI